MLLGWVSGTAALSAMLRFVVLWWCSWVACVGAFNLDTNVPIVKIGPPDSHFGYSVAQHKSFLPGAPESVSNKYKSWMLVGAPIGENLQPNTTKSGALFKCPLTTYTKDCQQVHTDGYRNSIGLYAGNSDGTLEGPHQDEVKDGQWMGVTLKSQGEGRDILVCGHRYQHRGLAEQNFQRGYGLCYRLDDSFDYKDNYQPCMGKPVNTEHEQFGYCQAGTSGLILDDEVVLGLPGTHTWRGTITTRNISGNYLLRDKTQYFGVYEDDLSPVNKYSYLGYSVTAGRFFGDHLSYVAGAPRASDTGEVIFFSRKKIGEPIMMYDLILKGEAFASSFGFEVLAMDTNGNNRDDLIVSAPFYFTKHSSGAVYVYVNDGTGISQNTRFIRLEGAPGESRFGYSMTSLGDLNLDGYNDLAVGAPYENKGAIYIFSGSESGIQKEPSQIIRAEDLPGIAYNAFGYALSGGMDLDNNNYNDLLTSSFCSDRVILLRARPIIDIQTKVDSRNLENINPNEPKCPEDRHSPETCFSFKACFKMNNKAGTGGFLSIHFNVSERYYNDQPTNRIRFHGSREDNPSTIQKEVNLNPQDMGEFQCSTVTVYLRKDQKDFLRPVRFKLSYKIDQKVPKPVEEGEELPDINNYPILNQKEAVRYFQANFAKDCGDDDICQSDLIITGELDLPRDATRDNAYIFELGKRQSFAFTPTVQNEGDPAYFPVLYVSHDKAIDLSLRESQLGSYTCAVNVEPGLLKCDLDNPILNTTSPLKLIFKPSGLPFKDRRIGFTAWVNATSEEMTQENNRITFPLEVKRRAEISITGSVEPEQVFYSGQVVGESAIKTLDEIGTAVTHQYLVDNGGPWKVDKLKVQIHWPYQTENNKKEGKWLLYMTNIPYVVGDGDCDVEPSYINPLNYGIKLTTGESEFDTGGNEKLTGGPPSPTSGTGTTIKKSSTKTKIKTTIKKSKTTTHDVDSSSSHSSSSSSSNTFIDNDNDFDDFEGSGNFGRGGTRTNVRVSRKVYSSSSKNKVKIDDKDVIDDFDYENYDNFFKKQDGHVISKTITEDDKSNLIDEIRSIKEGRRTYLNGYDKDGTLVWTSRGRYDDIHRHGDDRERTVHSRTEVTRRIYSGKDGRSDYSGNRGRFEDDLSTSESEIRRKHERRMEENARLLTEKMDGIVDFRHVKDGDETWVNGYDKDGNVIWSSISNFHNKGFSPSGRTDDGNERGISSSSSRTKFSYKETTRDRDGDGIGETERSWSSSVTDKDGTRARTGSSVSENSDWNTRTGPDWDRKDVSSSRRGYERKKSYSSTDENREYHGPDRDYSSIHDDKERGGDSFRKEYNFHENTRDTDGDGRSETKRTWSSSITENDKTEHDSGSSITDQHGTRIISGSSVPENWDRVDSTDGRKWSGRGSYSSRHYDVDENRASHGYDTTSTDEEGSGYSSYRKHYSSHSRTTDEDGDGFDETRRKWSSSVTGNGKTKHHSGSSLTDEHGTRILSGSAPDNWDRFDDKQDRDWHRGRIHSSEGDRSLGSHHSSHRESSSTNFGGEGRNHESSGGREWDIRREPDWGHRDSSSSRRDGYERKTSYSSGDINRSSHGHDRASTDQEGSGYSSYRKHYSSHSRTTDEDDDGFDKTRRKLSSSVTGNGKTEHHSGSSITDEDGTRIFSGSAPDSWDGFENRQNRDWHRERIHSSEGDRSFTSDRSSYGGDGRNYDRHSSPRGGHGYKIHSSSTGHGSKHRTEYSRQYIDEDGKPRERFDWDFPEHRRVRYHSNDDGELTFPEETRFENSKSLWGKSGGFRNRDHASYRLNNEEEVDKISDDGNHQSSSHRSSHVKSSRSFKSQNDEPYHSYTYSRAVVNDDTGKLDVYSQKIFKRKSEDRLSEVHGPYKEEEWSKDFHYEEQPLKRTKRELEYVIKPEAITDVQTGKTMQVVNFKCDGDVPTAKCFVFHCTIRNLGELQSATIKIPARLWNSTLVEDYPRVNFVSIKSKGKLILPEEIQFDQDESDDEDEAETLAYPNLLDQRLPEEVPLWVILVSVLAGLLLLVVIAIVLWKLGFFKRKRPDPTLSGNIDRDVNGYN